MAEIINGYVVTTSNASKKTGQRAGVTVKTCAGAVAAKIYSEHSKPLNFLRKYILSQERLELVNQMKQAGIAQADIEAIVAMREK
jgi:hypothetical protein